MADNVDVVLTNSTNATKYSTLDDFHDSMPVLDGHVYYDGDIENLIEPWRTDAGFIPSVTIFLLTFLMGAIGNSLVVFVMVGDKKSRSVTTLFLVSLAVADLMFLVICVPCELIKRFFINVTIGNGLCKVLGFIEMLSGVASVMNLMAVSVERYVVILFPMKARSLFTMGSTKRILVAVWFLSIVMSLPVIHVTKIEFSMWYKNSSMESDDFTKVRLPMCVDELSDLGRKAFAYYQLSIMFIIPTLVMIFCYTKVVHVLWISTIELAKMTAPDRQRPYKNDDEYRTSMSQPLRESGTPSHRNKPGPITTAAKEHSASVQQARKQVIKMLILVVVIFLVCWGPKLILNVMIKYRLSIIYQTGSDLIKNLILLLPYIQSTVNPIVYGFMSSNFRRSMRYSCRTYCFIDCKTLDKERSEFEMETKTNGAANCTSTVRKPTRRLTEGTTDADFMSVSLTDK